VRIESAELFALNIPFVMPLSHATHKNRAACDSVVLQLGSDGLLGYGEVVVRDYVSGALGGGADLLSRVAGAARRLLEPLDGRDVDHSALDAVAANDDPDPADLPVLCALETALLDLACRASGRDAYELLGLEPLRPRVAFSGVIPLFPPEIAARTLAEFARLGTRSFKIKLGPDPAANRAILAACRAVVGPGGDLRVDANGGWRIEDADANLDACRSAGVTTVEQPFPVAAPGADDALRRGVERGFLFSADEGFISERDLDRISRAGTYRMLNFRLAKNGGLARVLRLARTAGQRGIGYQLGCMAGETAILSALGRLAASLLPVPRWVEGGYDRILYAEHLADRDFAFGPDGTAPVVRGAGIGYTVSAGRLAALTVGRERIR
jgi:L-alanine-DL-glutamate epimerase-like enolase superfamily enzyme